MGLGCAPSHFHHLAFVCVSCLASFSGREKIAAEPRPVSAFPAAGWRPAITARALRVPLHAPASKMALQGRGLGGRLLAALLELWDGGDGGGLMLATQEHHARRLYQAHGFQLVHKDGRMEEAGSAHAVGAGYASWCLFRPATPAPRLPAD
jgi:hypothetical protein